MLARTPGRHLRQGLDATPPPGGRPVRGLGRPGDGWRVAVQARPEPGQEDPAEGRRHVHPLVVAADRGPVN